jgi:hypothetical protein
MARRARSLRLLGTGVLLAGTLLAQQALPSDAPQTADVRFLPRPEFVRVASLGFEALAADFYWLQAVQLLGSPDKNPRDHAQVLGRMVDATTRLDPWVDHPYRFAAIWLTDTPELVREANRLLERGIAYHPREWRNRFYLGFNHFFYLGDTERAAEVLEKAAQLEGAPRYLSRLVARLRAEGGGLDAAAVLLTELLHGAQDPFARAEIEKALDEVETERRARFLDRAREEYRSRFGHDIAAVEDLLEGPQPVLRELPAELHGWEWVLDPASGRIVSSYYGRRYELHFQGGVRPFARAAGSEEQG